MNTDFERLQKVRQKPVLQKWYRENYLKFQKSLAQCPSHGLAIELGSGSSFLKEMIPNIVTTDIFSFPNVDQVVDARKLPFEDSSVSFLCMTNVLHHISDVNAFFAEAQRCLKPGGRIFIVDQYPGIFAKYIYRYLHDEHFDQNARGWEFDSSNPLFDANGALSWIVFERDKEVFEKKFPMLRILKFSPHTPLRYWLSGGLKPWSLLPSSFFNAATWFDHALLKIHPHLGSFVDIELVRI